MNAITPITAVPARLAMTPSLADHLRRLVEKPFGYMPEEAPGLAREAGMLLPAAHARCGPITPAAFEAWIGPMAPSFVPAVTPDQFRLLKLPAIMLAIDDLPAGVLNPDTRREAAKAWKFCPTGADVAALLEPHARRIIADRDNLERVAAYRPPAESTFERPRERTPEEVEHVRNLVAGWKAEVAERQDADRRHREATIGNIAPKPRYADPLMMLRISYEQTLRHPKGTHVNGANFHDLGQFNVTRYREMLGVPDDVSTPLYLKRMENGA